MCIEFCRQVAILYHNSGFEVPQNVHWLKMVEFMACLQARRPAQVEEMIRQLEATRSESVLPHPTSSRTSQWLNPKVSG